MNRNNFTLGLLVFAAMLCGCSTAQTCVDFGYYFFLDEVSYDHRDTSLFVSGHSKLSYCAEEGERVNKFEMMQMDLSVDTLDYNVVTKRSHKVEKLEAPDEAQRLFVGEIGCFDCVLQVPTDDDLYLLSFTYNQETIQERIGDKPIFSGSLLLTIYSSGVTLSDFLFLPGQVDKYIPE